MASASGRLILVSTVLALTYAPLAAADNCDYKASNKGDFRELTKDLVGTACAVVRAKDHYVRPIVDASNFANECPVTLDPWTLAGAGAKCPPAKGIVQGDKFFVREWASGDLRLTIMHQNGKTGPSELKMNSGPTVAGGTAWISNTENNVTYVVYLDQRPGKKYELAKHYRLEVFETNDAAFPDCVKEIPTTATEDDCKNSPKAYLKQQSGSGGGGEPPPNPH